MVTEHQVRERAYYIWEIEGRLTGRAESHWLQAEAEFAAGGDAPVVEVTEPAALIAAPSAAKASKPAAKKVAKPAKAAEPKIVKAKRTVRAKVEQVALH